MAENWITTKETAQITGYHEEYLRTLIRDGKVKGQKFGPVWQVSNASLLNYLARAKESPDKRYGAKND